MGAWAPYSLEEEDKLLVWCSSRPGTDYIAGWHGRLTGRKRRECDNSTHTHTHRERERDRERQSRRGEEETLTVRKEEIESKP